MTNPYGPPHGQPQPQQQPWAAHPPQQPYGYPPNGYQQPPMPTQQPVSTHNTAGILALVFGIAALALSLFPDGWRFGFLGGIVAAICGITGRTRAKHGIATNKHLSTAGLILGVLAAAGSAYMIATFGA